MNRFHRNLSNSHSKFLKFRLYQDAIADLGSSEIHFVYQSPVIRQMIAHRLFVQDIQWIEKWIKNHQFQWNIQQIDNDAHKFALQNVGLLWIFIGHAID